MKIDLHVHSRHSTRPSQWVLQKIGCPESFIAPAAIYDIALRKGMTHVTISDHNTIDGALEIAHLPNTFISEEITAFFPQDRCKVHVLAWDIDEAIHQDVQHLRDNIYDLVAYLQSNNIKHGCAHPLFAVNDKLNIEHVEQMMLLFKTFEINGTRDGMQSAHLKDILALLDERIIHRLAEKYNIVPNFDAPWEKNLMGGSDDHSGLNIARIFTQAQADDVPSFFAKIFSGQGQVHGMYASPKTMAHNLYSIGYQFFKDKYALEGYVNKDKFLKFLDCSLMAESAAPTGIGGVWTRIQAGINNSGVLRKKRKEVLSGDPALIRRMAEDVFQAEATVQPPANLLEEPGTPEERWFQFTNKTANRVLAHHADSLLDDASSANLFSIFQTIAASGALYTALSPYFIAYGLFTKDRAFCKDSLSHFNNLAGRTNAAAKPFKLAHFTDTFFDMNGVAITLREHVKMASMSGKDYTVLTCSPREEHAELGVKNFLPIGLYDLPEYPDLKVFYPPLLEMLSYVYENGFTHIHSATPGPIGMCALLISKILKLPISGTYHTAFPQYAGQLTGDNAMEELMWKGMIYYYNQMDKVYVPSNAVGDELAAKGIAQEKIQLYPRGVDTTRFTPTKRNGFFKQFNLNGGRKLLYVGRISKEKNLPLLTDVFKQLSTLDPNLNLIVVGDGPYRKEMQSALSDVKNCCFTGKLDGDDLAAAYASSDLLIFPSATDTFGKVVLEAQASGLPVIVTDQGGPQENVLPGQTGVVVKAQDPQALLDAAITLLENPDRLKAMGREARTYMQTRSIEQCFEQTWEIFNAN